MKNMSHDFEQLIAKAAEGNEYTLSNAERENMTRIVREYAAMKPLPRARSYSVSVSYGWFTFAHRPVAAALVLCVIFGSGVSYAAESALPGDALYAIKTYINEPARVALATSAEARAEVQIELAERRIEEAAVLAAEGRLDSETEDELAAAFESHAEAVAEHIAKADHADEGVSVELASRFENRLAAHESILLEVEGSDELAHSARLAVAIRAASEAAINLSAGTSLAIAFSATHDAPAAARGSAAPGAHGETAAHDASAMGAEPAMTMSITSAAAVDTVEVTAQRAKVAVTAPAQAPAIDAKTISRMKSAAEKSLRSAQKKFRSAKSLSAEARAQAEANLALADSLITEGAQHLEADADMEAFAAFKESLRVSEQANVYMKAAPTLEKARSRARNTRGVESRVESRGASQSTNVEVGPINATVTLPVEMDSGKTDSRNNQETPGKDEKPSEPDVDSGPPAEGEVKIKLDLSL